MEIRDICYVYIVCETTLVARALLNVGRVKCQPFLKQ